MNRLNKLPLLSDKNFNFPLISLPLFTDFSPTIDHTPDPVTLCCVSHPLTLCCISGDQGPTIDYPLTLCCVSGDQGPPGFPGQPGESIQLNPYIVAFHSQRTEYPKCLDGMTELWRGYSFMFIDGRC